MRRHGWLLLAASLLAASAFAQADRFRVGDRVVQPTTGLVGTVLEIAVEKHQVRIRFDERGAGDPGSWFFWGTPDLKLSDQPASAPKGAPAAPPGGAGGAGPSANSGAPAGCRRPEKGFEAPPARGALTEAVVRKGIEERLLLPIGAYECMTFDWHGVKIERPVRKDQIEGLIEGAPADTPLYPVRAELDSTLRSTKSNFQQTFERVAYAYFWADERKHWAFGWIAHAGTKNTLRRD